jgi:hypothetical protein
MGSRIGTFAAAAALLGALAAIPSVAGATQRTDQAVGALVTPHVQLVVNAPGTVTWVRLKEHKFGFLWSSGRLSVSFDKYTKWHHCSAKGLHRGEKLDLTGSLSGTKAVAGRVAAR